MLKPKGSGPINSFEAGLLILGGIVYFIIKYLWIAIAVLAVLAILIGIFGNSNNT